MISAEKYIDDYFYYVIDHASDCNKEIKPPIDYIWDVKNLGSIDEDSLCKWVMIIIKTITLNIKNENKGTESGIPICWDSEIRTFEDQYYLVLAILYNTYMNN